MDPLAPKGICSGQRCLVLLHLAGEGVHLSSGGSGCGVRGSGGLPGPAGGWGYCEEQGLDRDS